MDGLGRRQQGDPADAETLATEKMGDEEWERPPALERELGSLIPPHRLDGLDTAVDVLYGALQAGERILVVGDFDADGATSCALAVRCLRAFGHQAVDFLVPNRFDFGYGLTPEIVDHARRFDPDVIVTVDNGVSSIEGVAAARALGWQVIVTDHHLAGAELPAAHALVNPNLPGSSFPSRALAGVGVIFYLLLGLRSHLRERGWFTQRGLPTPNMADYLDLVALGTVAGVVPLDRNNRILVDQGLRRIRAGQSVPGIAALFDLAGRSVARAVSTDLGFVAGFVRTVICVHRHVDIHPTSSLDGRAISEIYGGDVRMVRHDYRADY